MGLKAEVHFAGHIFKILVYYRRMHQTIDEVNKPIGRPTGHLIDLVLESSKETNEFLAWLVGQGMKELKIVFSPVTGNGKSRTVLLRDAYCVFFKEHFDADTAYPMTSTVAISAGIVDDSGVIHFEYWKVSNIIPLKFESKPEIVLTPKISKITWIDAKTQEKTEETTYGNKIALAVKIANHKSGTASIKIEKEDGTEFENGEKSFTYVESVDEDGIAEISEIDIKEQWEEFKTADKDTLVATVEYLGATKKSKPLQLKSFDVKIKLLKDNKTIVPMGIPDFSGTKENKFIEFEVEILEKDIDNFDLEILKDDKVIYSQFYGDHILEEVTVIGKASKNGKEQKDTKNQEDSQEQESETTKKCKVGNYRFKWDGFIQGKYDSTLFLDGEFKARIKGHLNQAEKTAETKTFSFKRDKKKIDWVDIKIDENAKRIDVSLRINLRDGGEKGTEKYCKVIGRNRALQKKVCPWDKIPEKMIKKHGEPIKTPTKTFEELRSMALDGVSKYWSRKLSNTDGGTIIDGENYELNVNAVQDKKGMKAPKIIYFTNSKETNFTRSHNWEASRKLFYIVGYTIYKGDWDYEPESRTSPNFIETSAHEIGHEILLEYGGQLYSKKHKGSSTIGQDTLPNTPYPNKGEIDLMKYSSDRSLPKNYYNRVVASRKDTLSLVWLTKMRLK